MTLTEHLYELRRRVVISLLAVLVMTIVAYIFHGHLLHWIEHPYCQLPQKDRPFDNRCTLFASGVLEPFTITLKLSLYAGVVGSSPVGLYAHERRYAIAFVGASMVLFALGGVFAWLTLQKGLSFLLGFANGGIVSLLQFSNYLSFVVAMVLIFAISFELPLLVVMLNLVGMVSAARLRRWARGVAFGIFVFAAVATPSQDPFTMTALAVPMCLLYGLAVLIATVHDRRMARRPGMYADLSDDELSSIDDEPALP